MPKPTQPRRVETSVTGLVPAAGYARRWQALGFSKELYPFPREGGGTGPAVVTEYLLHGFKAAGIGEVIVVTRKEKADIPGHLSDGVRLGLKLDYVMLESSPSVPHSVVAAMPLLPGGDVLLGFPDIVFSPADAPGALLARWRARTCDVLLGLFETDRPERADMVQLGAGGRVRRIIVKPRHDKLRFAWIFALWNERFAAFLEAQVEGADALGPELHLGEVFQQALEHGLTIEGFPIAGGRFLDVGTASDGGALSAFVGKHGLARAR